MKVFNLKNKKEFEEWINLFLRKKKKLYRKPLKRRKKSSNYGKRKNRKMA